MIDRRAAAKLVGASLAWPAMASQAADTRNILRIVFPAAETGFDPAQVSDSYSTTVCAHLFEAPYAYDPLAVPVKPKPLTAVDLPVIEDDHRRWTLRIRPGIFFTDHPAFHGRPRELTAADYVYSFKRFFDPATNSPGYTALADEGIVGLQALRDQAVKDKRPFDYDREIEGLRALDRYTLQFRLAEPRPRFIQTLCDSSTYGALAREVVEAHGAEVMAHPVGTGPYRLAAWRRSSRIVLERNPGYRDRVYEAEPAADDLEGQRWAKALRGRRLPLNDGVEIAIIEEGQPRWLAFLNGELDAIAMVPPQFAPAAAPNGVLAPYLAKRGVQMRRYVMPDFTMSWFNMEDPVVGGYTPEKVALRRAIELAFDVEREIQVVRQGQAVRAQAAMQPGTFGHDPAYRSINSACDPARAQGLLDVFGYVDRDGDGWRELPDGRPLVIRMATQQSAIERAMDENWQRSLARVGIRLQFDVRQWPENMKAARAGRLQMWALASTATRPDGQQALSYMYGAAIGQGNLARARLPGFDDLFRRMLALPDGPERAKLFLQASDIVSVWMPYRIHTHRIAIDLAQPWVTGWRVQPFRREAWHYARVDGQARG